MEHFGRGHPKAEKICYGNCQGLVAKGAFSNINKDDEWSKCESRQRLCIDCKDKKATRRGFEKPSSTTSAPSASLVPGQVCHTNRARTATRLTSVIDGCECGVRR